MMIMFYSPTEDDRHELKGKPVWSPDGKRIYYRGQAEAMYAVDVTATDTFTKGNPKKIFEGNYLPTGRRFDIHPDGKSFIMIQPDVGPQAQKIFVIQNFDEELKRLVPGGKP
ncbi:PD40 domain-containing protein [candidate division KSB1 bacterium]|nr:PD40 domain-containing protein [candidate division KSB1 bacterium]